MHKVKVVWSGKSVKGYLSLYKKILRAFLDRIQREDGKSVSRGIYGSPCRFEFLARLKSDREMIVARLMVCLCFFNVYKV